jgi:hypothetical protein
MWQKFGKEFDESPGKDVMIAFFLPTSRQNLGDEK